MANIEGVTLPDNSEYDLKDAVSGYATKVANATNGNLAGLDANGDLTDSGKKASDFLLESDIADDLVTADATMALSANMGVKIADNLAANEKSGAKNFIPFPYEDGMSKTFRGVTYTVASDGSVASANTATSDGWFSFASNATFDAGDYKLSGCPSGGSNSTYYIRISITRYGGAPDSVYDTGNGATFTLNEGDVVNIIYIGASNGTNMGGLTFKPMIYDARIIDPSFVPPAKTNKQLTDDKAERNDLSTIHATGRTNTTGAQIDAGTFFYLNGQFCKALTNIAVNATFTLDTNFKVDSVGKELKDALDYSGDYAVSGIPFASSYGGTFISLSLPIPKKLRNLYSYTFFNVYLCGGNFPSELLTIDSDDAVSPGLDTIRLTRTLANYFATPGAQFNSLSALVSANASITLTVRVS